MAYFESRLNRFLVRCRDGNRLIRAFLPNPGRLMELLLPGRRLYLVRDGVMPSRKTTYTVVAVEREGLPIMLHTHRTNDVAHYLLRHQMVPGLEGASVKAREVRVGQSRFDFLLEREGKTVIVEVKSCTLFGKRVAMFPDAVSERGARHLHELASLARNGTPGAVLFIVHWPHARVFMPDYHTDLAFTKALLEARQRIEVIPLSIGWNLDLSLCGSPKLLGIPWHHIEVESKDRGSYLLIIHLRRRRRLRIGGLGEILFPRGFYIYVGSAMRGLERRIARHRRLRKRPHWHVDGLRAVGEFRAALPIRSSVRLECSIAEALEGIADWRIPEFGSTDCACRTHLFGMEGDPFHREDFHDLLQYFRMDRYESTPSGRMC
jgi:sugar fermentation stimulation protein A